MNDINPTIYIYMALPFLSIYICEYHIIAKLQIFTEEKGIYPK
jgi:hypothetical protein